jgi:hypothetical protein
MIVKLLVYTYGRNEFLLRCTTVTKWGHLYQKPILPYGVITPNVETSAVAVCSGPAFRAVHVCGLHTVI